MEATRRAPPKAVRDWCPPDQVQAWVSEQAVRLNLPYETVLFSLFLRFICHLNGQSCAIRASGLSASAWAGTDCLVSGLDALGQGDADDDMRRLNAVLSAYPQTLEQVQQPIHAEMHVRAIGVDAQVSSLIESPHHPVTLDIIGTSEIWRLCWHADIVALEPVSIQHMAWQFEAILHHLAQGGSETTALLACASLERGKADQSHSKSILDQDLPSLFEQFEHQARHKPDAIFLASEGLAISYGSARHVIETWASAMRAKAQDWIAVDACVDETSILLMLAAWRAGLAYIPLDTQMPVERLRPLLQDFGGRLVLAMPADNAGKLTSVATAGFDVLPLSFGPRPEDPGHKPEPLARCDNPLAYVVLTSGSTGTAKSVCLSHRSLAWSTAARFDHYHKPVRRFLLLSPAYVDSAIAGIFWTIASGGELWIASANHRQDALSIAKLLIDRQPSHMLCLPSLYQAVLESLPRQSPPALSVAVVAGEAATTKVVELHESRLPDALLYNEYGPSEGCVWASVQQCRSGPQVVPIGVGVAHVDISLREAPARRSLIGAQGEIHLGGDAIAIGYWNRPALTAEKFLPDPYAARAGLRAYRTGDYARISAGGVLTFHGRKDSQVKISGYRVELGEVKSCLETHADVIEAHVDAIAQGDSLSLAAWLVLKHGRRSMQEESLRNHIAQHLPAYMRPAMIVFVEQIPRMRSGKVDATALPKPSHDHQETHSDTGPTTAMERLIAGIWSELLGRDVVERDADFFQLGGNSLRAIQATVRFRDALNFEEIGAHHLMENPRLQDLARVFDTLLVQEPEQAPTLVALDLPDDTPLPASFFQQRLFVLQKLDTQSAAYHCPFVLDMDSGLDIARLEAALNRCVLQFPILRSRFFLRGGEVYQCLRDTPPITLAPDQSLLHADHDSGQNIILREIEKPFALDHDPLYRFRLFQTRTGWTLAMTIHHLIFDGWSINLFAQALSSHYGNQTADASHDAGQASTLQFRDFAAWQHQKWQSGAWGKQIAYWQDLLANANTVLDLPTDRPRSAQSSSKGETLHFRFDAACQSRIAASCQRLGITAFMFLQSCFALALHRYSGQSDILVGTALSLRSMPGSEALLGPLLNTVVLRNRIDPRRSFSDLAHETRSQVINLQAHGDLPFEKLVETVAPTREPGRPALFQALFVLDDVRKDKLNLNDVGWRAQPHRSSHARFDLSIAMLADEAGLSGQLEFATDLFDTATAERILATFKSLVEVCADAPHDIIWRLAARGDDAHSAALDRWENGPRIEPRDSAEHALTDRIRQQVRQHCDATALCFDGQNLSYGQLWRSAMQIRDWLHSQDGWSPGQPVGVFMPRSLLLPVALLGILEADCAILPLDHDAPPERLRMIWRSAGEPSLIHHAGDVSWLPDGVACLDLAQQKRHPLAAGTPLRPRPDQHSIACLMYTSGSTGEPKGVLSQHRALVNRLDWMQAFFKLRPDQRVLQKTPITFDVSLWEFFWPLREGATMVLAAPGEERSPALLRARLEREQIEILHFVPSMLTAVLRQESLKKLPALSQIICSGEALACHHAEGVFEQTLAQLSNLYGPTEAAIDVTAWLCQAADQDIPPIGLPIDNVSCRILDPWFGRCPAQAPGELFIGGIATAMGYFNRPALTALNFLPDPHADRPGMRLYKTGDLARFRADGALLYLGRKDSQIKLRGIRIEPAEVEAILLDESNTREAVIHVHPEAKDTLIAFIVLHDPRLGTQALHAHARRHLPSTLVPSHFIVVEQLPKTTSGKVDRKRLSLPLSDPAQVVAVSAETESERRLILLWERLVPGFALQLDKGFFANGGHSLLALKFCESIATAFNVTLPLEAVLRSSSMRDIARWIDDLSWINASSAQQADAPSSDSLERLS